MYFKPFKTYQIQKVLNNCIDEILFYSSSYILTDLFYSISIENILKIASFGLYHRGRWDKTGLG